MSEGMNLALRSLCVGRSHTGEGPIEVMTRFTDFNVVTVTGPQGQPMNAPANSLIAFTAHAFRELLDETEARTGVWEFRVDAPTPGGGVASARMFFSGTDLLSVRAMSKVVV